MARPPKCRRIGREPEAAYFKPRGIPLRLLEEVRLTLDEFEALRLADLEGLYQEQAAERMKVSRQTFGNIVTSARRKVALAIVKGQAIRIEGGAYRLMGLRHFRCGRCRHEWKVPSGSGRPGGCPECRSPEIHRTGGDPGSRQGCGNAGRPRCGHGRALKDRKEIP